MNVKFVFFIFIASLFFASSSAFSELSSGDESGEEEIKNNPNVIKKININIHPIFDETNPKEDNFIFRLTNRLHIGTDVDVIKNDLLFKEGSVLDKDALYESERILRSRRYLNRSSVTLKDLGEGEESEDGVEVDVDVNEVWTLVPTFGFSRTGGNDEYSVGFQDSNFLGYGKSFTVEYNSSDERNGKLFEYKDPNTGWYQTQLGLAYENNSDGSRHFFSFKRPYFSLSTPNAGGIEYDKFIREEGYFNEGDEVSSYERSSEISSVYYGSKFNFSSEFSIHRWNVGYLDENEKFNSIPDQDEVTETIAPPENRVFKIVWGEYQFIQNQYSRFKNVQQINRVEDINLGWQSRFKLGYVYSPISKFDESLYLNASLYRGYHFNEKNILLFKTSLNGFYGESEIYNGLVRGSVDYHWQTSPGTQFYLSLNAARGLRLFQDQFLSMGGEQSLRAYDDNYQSGDKRYALNIEQRFYGKKEWLSLFYMGFVVFYDEGRSWGNSASPQDQDGRLRDFGVGLRFSGTRNGSREEGSHNVLHVDFAKPLDGGDDLSSMELSIRVRKSF